ncbi:hypothetical protein [Treponema sp. R80B11-R83G3]
MFNLKNTLGLSDGGYRDFKRGVAACVLSNLTMLPPFVVMLQIIITLLDPLLSGNPINTAKLWILLCGTSGLLGGRLVDGFPDNNFMLAVPAVDFFAVGFFAIVAVFFVAIFFGLAIFFSPCLVYLNNGVNHLVQVIDTVTLTMADAEDKGRKEGNNEANIKNARKMKADNMPVSQICKYTDLSPEIIAQL